MQFQNFLCLNLNALHYPILSVNEYCKSRLERVTCISTMFNKLLCGFRFINHTLKLSCFCLCNASICFSCAEFLYQSFMRRWEIFIRGLNLLANVRKQTLTICIFDSCQFIKHRKIKSISSTLWRTSIQYITNRKSHRQNFEYVLVCH